MRRRSTSLAPQPVLEYGRSDYGSALRDAAALVTLASEGNAPRATITGGGRARRGGAAALDAYTSTQENAWMVLAARALAKDAQPVSLDVGGETAQGRALSQLQRRRRSQQPLQRRPIPARRRCRRWCR